MRRLWFLAGLVLVVLVSAVWLVLRPQPANVFISQPADSVSSTVDLPSPSFVASPAATVPSHVAPKPGAKKGVCVWEAAGLAEALKDVRAGWYYNWSSRPTAAAGSSAEFVPMIWGAGAVNATELNRAKASGKTLLGFNEPDFASQANMTVEKALELWPQLQATGLRLGSPAVAVKAAEAGGWLDRFLKGAKERQLRVDFIALHWYGSEFSDATAGHLKSYVQAVWDRYHLPIWLTEFALIRFASGGPVYPSDAQQSSFITKATAMLKGLSYVERFAWFALPLPKEGHQGTALYRGTTPTPAGIAYRSG